MLPSFAPIIHFFDLLSALIPVAELCDPHVMKKYGVTPDAETLEILTCAAKEKEVIALFDL